MLFGTAQQRRVGGSALEVQVRLVLPGESDATVHLNAVGGDPTEGSRTCRLRNAHRQCGIVTAIGQRPHRVIGRRSGVLEVDEHVGELVLDRLKGSDVAAELHTGLGVVH